MECPPRIKLLLHHIRMILDYEDLEQINVDDLEEMDLKWQVAMLTILINKENTHKQVEYPRKSQSLRDNRRNWNGTMTQKLGNGFEFIKTAWFWLTGQRKIRPVWNNAQRVNHQNKLTHPHPKRNFVPTVVATKSGQVPVNAAKQNSPRATTSISTARTVNTATPKPKVNDALPTTYTYFKAHSQVNNVTTTGPKAIVSAAEGNGENAGNPQYTLQDQGIFDSGCSRHMTRNKSFLTDYQEINGGFVAFGGSPKGDKITQKGKIRTGKLDFEDVYFVKELKFNLFSVLQMCDKKNSVLFTETEYLVLSPDFKLLDEIFESLSMSMRLLYIALALASGSVRTINQYKYCL
ncbi:hypothetical protein Tco_0213652 [Tanacetum coccineum]